MKTRRTYLLRFLVSSLFVLLLSRGAKAQSSIAVDWEQPENLEEFRNDLQFFNEINASFLILSGPISTSRINDLNEFNIPYLIRTNNRFITQAKFKADSSSFIDQIETITALGPPELMKGVILFTDSNVKPFHVNTSFDVYFEKNQKLENGLSKTSSSPSPVYFQAVKNNVISIHNFKSKLEKHSIIIVDSEWLKSTSDQFPGFKDALTYTSKLNPELILLPEIPNQLPTIHWSILVLLLLWISLAVNVATNPTYLETIPRYFTAHRFYVDDIMSYRERSSASAVFLLFQHAIFGGLVVYILSKIFISDTGLEALYHHIPYIAVMGKNYFSLFVLSSVLVLIVELIALIWLYVPNKEMTHFNQGLNLFTSIFHLDFIIVTAIVTGYFGNWNTTLISFLALSYLLIWFSSFNITAFDASKRLGMHRNSYLFKTIGLHTLVSCALVVLLAVFNEWWDILKLTVSV